MSEPRAQALEGLRVVDCSTVLAGPGCARYLADFGADVIKVERPDTGDTTRSMGWRDPRDGVTLFWKLLGRGKRTIVLDLKDPDGLATMLDLVAGADVLIENFRPGTLERLGLGPDVLHQRNPELVITRVTGFGQDGPYASRPGFATLAEAMSGLAAINGEPDGPPLLPPIALADEVTGLVAAFEDAHAACAPVFDMADLAVDPHMAARDAIVEVDGIRMQGVVAKLSETPGRIRWTGRPLGADQAEVLAELDRDGPEH